MLEYLRNMSGKPVAKILMAILIFSFVGWGVADWIFSNTIQPNALVTVGDYEITMDGFNAEKNRRISMMEDAQRKQIYTDAKFANEVYSEILTEMINDLLIENKAKDLGFVVSDKRIAAEIASYPEFQENGNFSSWRFDAILNASGHTEASFAGFIRSQMLRSMVMMAMNYPVAVPDFAAKAAYNARYMTKDVKFATVKFADQKIEKSNDKDLEEFYKKNPKMMPETRVVEYVLVGADMNKPDSYDAGYNKIIMAEDEIIGGATFGDAAKKSGGKYVKIPSFAKNEKIKDKIVTDSILDQVFGMQQGIESGIIETKDGFAIVRVSEIKPSYAQSFADAKKSIIKDFEKSEQEKVAYLKANEILIDVNAGKDVKSLKSATVSRMDGAPTDVLVAAYANPIGANVIVESANAFYVLSVVGEKMPKVDDKKMNDIKKEVETMTTRGIFDDYNSYLMRQYKIDLNEKELEKIMAK